MRFGTPKSQLSSITNLDSKRYGKQASCVNETPRRTLPGMTNILLIKTRGREHMISKTASRAAMAEGQMGSVRECISTVLLGYCIKVCHL